MYNNITRKPTSFHLTRLSKTTSPPTSCSNSQSIFSTHRILPPSLSTALYSSYPSQPTEPLSGPVIPQPITSISAETQLGATTALTQSIWSTQQVPHPWIFLVS